MTENRKRFPGMLAWVAFLAASIIILIIASSALHYAPGSSGGTLADEFGAVLPYALIGGLLLYYVLRPIKRSEATLRGTRSFFSNLGTMFVMAVMFLVVVFIVKFLSIPTVTPTQPPVPKLPNPEPNELPGSAGSPNLSPIVFVGAIVVVVGVAVFLSLSSLRRRAEAEGETVDFDTDDWGAKKAPVKFEVDDIRRAILYRYVQGRDLLVRQGATLDEGMTAREFERKVVSSYEDTRGDFVPLTRLFEEARFSIHPMGQVEKEKADNHYLKLKTTSEPENNESPKTET